MLLFILLQTAPAQQGANVRPPEWEPALLSLIYLGGLGLLCLVLLLALFRSRRRRSPLDAVAPADLPKEVRQRLGITSTNRGLRAMQALFALLAIGVFCFHVYWGHYAADTNERFQEVAYKDLRNRRLTESTLRGWILDRSGQLDKAFARYSRDGSGQITRDYPMDEAMAHILGSDRGDPGLERALFGAQSGTLPDAWQVVTGDYVTQKINTDVRLTIDRDLQQEAVNQLKGRYGAVVVLNPQTGEVLAMYSNPSYSLKEAQDEAAWIRLEADKRNNRLVNRALGAYYVPGSTFKTVIMTGAFLAGLQNETFSGYPGGFVAGPGAPPITDDNGSCEICGSMKIDDAFEISSNQYFAQMGVKLGPDGLKRVAQPLGIGTYSDPGDLLRGRKEPEIWNASTDAVKRAMAPRQPTILTSPKMTHYDLALEGFGQGYASQMTPFQMALNAAMIANLNGRLMKAKIEYDRPPEVFNQVVAPDVGSQMRTIMGLVTGGPRGTARGAFTQVAAAGIKTGGKTGTAQKEVPEYDPKTGEEKKVRKYERDRKGNIIREYDATVMSPQKRIDSWFLCIAPLEQPQLAIAVIIEGGGYGSKAAAPVAAALVLRARELGLFPGGEQTGQLARSDAQKPRNRQNPQTQATPASNRR